MRVVVLGAGYAGVTAARILEDSLPRSADLRVVDDTGEHLLQHELHRVVRRPSMADVITIPVTDLLEEVTVIEATATGIESRSESVTISTATAGSKELFGEYLVCCLGAETSSVGVDGVRENAIPLRTTDHALAIHERALECCTEGGRLVVSGAGLSGVQVAGELAALIREQGATDSVEIILLEQADAVAPTFPHPFRKAIDTALRESGVTVRTGVEVTGVSRDTVSVRDTVNGPDSTSGDEERIAAHTVVWTGGIRGPAILDGTRPTVRADLRLSESTFVAGDCARIIDADGQEVPASAASAVRAAGTAARNVARLVDHEDESFEPRLERFRFDSPGWVVSIGDRTVAQLGTQVFTGRPASALKTTIATKYLLDRQAIQQARALLEAEFGE